MATDSILVSTKKALGIPATIDEFDLDVIMHINAVLSTMGDFGMGPTDGFEIEDDEAKWDSFLLGDKRYNFVKTYVYLKVRLLFDPPSAANLVISMEKMIAEYEWRMTALKENDKNGVVSDERTVISGGRP